MNTRPSTRTRHRPRETMTEPRIINFGKYKSKTFRWIADNDPEYLDWLLTKTLIGGHVREDAQQAMDALTRRLLDNP